ncbi:MAG TPA: PHP domain-containing protein [Syntrophales bacterium]|nr:PHP domain-containing protein [Syntrophales bacterium]HOL58986.1 PHP domain-containing protein [Syntrophales bacterium]HPO34736.1 PHP domain-containing protein [Syntrophales bacterium]
MKKIDLHVHTRRYSDCAFTRPEDIITRALEEGLDGIALTEHGVRWPDQEFSQLLALAKTHNLLLINGQEIYTTDSSGRMEGEFLVFGIGRSLTGNYRAEELIDLVHGEGGIVIAAHPYKLSRNGKMHYYGAGDRLEYLPVDAVEHFHPDHNERARGKVEKIMRKRGLPGTGGSDAHVARAIGLCYTIFEVDIASEQELIEEIRAGRVRGEQRPSRVKE